MLPGVNSLFGLSKEISKDTIGSIASINSLKSKNFPLQYKRISFGSFPEKNSLDENNRPKPPFREPSEPDFSCLKFPDLKGNLSGATIEDKVEQVSLGEILSLIEPISKQMEKDKKIKVEPFRFFDSPAEKRPDSLLSSPVIYKLPFVKDEQRGNSYIEWRGIVADKFQTHLFQTSWFNMNRRELYKKYLNELSEKPEKKKKSTGKGIRAKSTGLGSDIKSTAPHFDIYFAFRPQLQKRKDKMSSKILKTVILLQAVVRGWLERTRLARVKAKAKDHGPTFQSVVNSYRRMVDRIQRRAGLRNTRVLLKLSELEEWLDRKKFYEVMYAKNEYSKGIPKNELSKYFSNCGHFPTQANIDSTYLLIQKCDEIPSENVKMGKAIEMLFTLYPPEGAHVSHIWGIKSTWTRPIVNGEEGYKYIASGHPAIKKADIQVVKNLVARSMRERRMKIRFKSPD
ncbi:IQ domain-containing protein M [Macrotis lagotis]|uniref:IQ domain-containing protein M n=1 Tax=Macrotis lagotis TaxID=92651 RepID=UPI003D691690